MSRWTPIPLVGGAYADDCVPWSQQDCLNYIPVMAERGGTRSPSMLRDAPGLDAYVSSLTSAPVRGLYDVEGRLLAVAGTTLYKISSLGVPTSLGTIPGIGRVTFAHNQVTGGNQVAIGNGQSGYVYDTRDDTLVQITDDAFPGFKSVAFKDQFILGVEPSGRYWFHSDLADALSYSTLDQQEAEVAPDRIQLVIPSGDDVVVLGERTGQFFAASPDNAEGAFENRPGTAMTVGAASPWCAATLDNTVYWLGHDGTVYRLAGYTPQRVSTFAIEQALSRCDIAQAFAFVYEDRGHKVFYLTLPDGHTWGFDVASNEWHRRGSYGLTRWRLSALVKSGRTWIGGDYAEGNLYRLNWNTSHEAGEPLERRRVGALTHDDENALLFNGFRVVFNTGVDDLPAPSISGNVPDGEVGEAVSGSYVVSGGMAPYSAITVLSGTFPPGLTLDPDGSYSGTYTTAGTYSWTVGGTDAAGQPFSTPDTAVVSEVPMTLFAGVDNGFNILVSADGGVTWPTTTNTGGDFTTSAVLVAASNGRAFRFYSDEGRTSTDLTNWSAVSGLNPGSGNPACCLRSATEWLVFYSGAQLLFSTTGTSFTVRSVPSASAFYYGGAQNGQTMLVGGPAGGINRTTDGGVNWTLENCGLTGEIYQVIWTGVNWIAFSIADAAGIAYSPTGLTGSWTTVARPSTNAINHAAFGGGIALAVSRGNGSVGQVITSTDHGVSWSVVGTVAHFNAPTSPQTWTALRYAAGVFVFGTTIGAGVNGIYTSPTGVAWTQRYSASGGNNIHTVAEFTP